MVCCSPPPPDEKMQHRGNEKQREDPASRQLMETAGSEISQIKACTTCQAKNSAQSLRAQGNEEVGLPR